MTRRHQFAVSVVTASIAVVVACASPAWAKSDKQIARASTLRISDFPAGWTTSPHTESSPSKLPACRTTTEAAKQAKPYGSSAPDFGLSSGGTQTAQATNRVFVFPTVKQAKAYLAAFQLPTARKCLQAGLDQATKGSSVKATVASADLSTPPVDGEVGLAAILTSSLETVYYEAFAFRVGRGVTTVTTQNIGIRLPHTAILAATGIKRLEKNLAAG